MRAAVLEALGCVSPDSRYTLLPSLLPLPLLGFYRELAANAISLASCQLPRSNKICPVCKHDEAVFFQSQQRSAETGMVSRCAESSLFTLSLAALLTFAHSALLAL